MASTASIRLFLLKTLRFFLKKQSKLSWSTELQRGAGALKSPKDKRDFKHSALAGVVTIPKQFSLRGTPQLSTVEDQGTYNSCVACAGCTTLETFARRIGATNFPELSKMDAWNKGRKKSKTYPENKGMYVRDFWKVAQDKSQEGGISVEATFPYIEEQFNKQPTFTSILFRHLYPDFEYLFITGKKEVKKDAIKEVLYTKQWPIVVVLPITQSIHSLENNQYAPQQNEVAQFHHAVVIVGYDDAQNTFLLMNSWGKYWGDQGFFTMDQNMFIEQAIDLSYPSKVVGRVN